MADDNGAAPTPPPADEPAPAGVPVSDRMMALFGFAVAVLLGLIAIDLWSGGKLADLIPSQAPGDG